MTDAYPRIPQERYRIYARTGVGDPGETLMVVATCPDAEAVGVALATLHAEGQLLGRVGILDTDGGRGTWIINPYETGRQP